MRSEVGVNDINRVCLLPSSLNVFQNIAFGTGSSPQAENILRKDLMPIFYQTNLQKL